MNTFNLIGMFKKTLIAGIACAMFAVSFGAYAQQGLAVGHSKPPKESVPLLPAQPSGTWWPGGNFANTSFSTFDYYGSQYLPYLYSIGLNMGLMVDYADFFYKMEAENVGGNKPYMHDVTALANIKLSDTFPSTLEQTNEMTSEDVKSALEPGDITLISKELIDETPGSDITLPCVGSSCGPNDVPDNKAFNADSLLSIDGYSADEAPTIDKLITFLSGNVDATAGLGLSNDPDKRKEQLANSDMQRLVLLTRSLVASQSVALSNLNFLAKERQIIPDLGQQAGMTSLPTNGSSNNIQNASQLQLEEFLINRRVGNSSWYADVNTARPIALQRETLFVLAEIQQQLFQLRMVNERLLAAMSVMQFQMAQINKSQMSYIQQNVAEAASEEGKALPTTAEEDSGE